MKQNQIENQVLPADWSQVIDRVQHVLTQTEKAAGERARHLAQEPVPPKEMNAAWQQTLEHFEEGLQRFRAALQKAEDDAEGADLALADGEKAFEQWLIRARQSAADQRAPNSHSSA
jgi:hypothetical protein